MTEPLTPEQACAAERVRAALRSERSAVAGAGGDTLFPLFAAAMVNMTLADAAAAYRGCDEGVDPTLPEPTPFAFPNEAAHDSDARAADAFAAEWTAAPAAGAAGLGWRDAAAWFRTHAQTLPTVVTIAADSGFDVQCWQIAAYCNVALAYEGALAEAEAISIVGLAAAQRCNDDRAVALMHLACGGVAKMSGRLTEAMDHYDAAMPVFQQLDDVMGQASVMLRRGAVHMRRRELKVARSCQLNVLAITNIPALTALATGNLGCIALKAGDYTEAVTNSHAALRIIDDASIPAVRQVMEVNAELTNAYLALGDLPAAKRHIEAALAAIKAARDNLRFASVQVAVHRAAGHLALAENNPAAALTEFTHALAIRSGSTVLMADLLEGIGRAILAGGDPISAQAVLQAALAQRRVDGQPLYTAGTLAHLAAAHQNLDPQRADKLRAEALTHLEPLTDRPAQLLRQELAAI